MKIKNIFNTAFLKLWLVLFALIPTAQTVMGVEHTVYKTGDFNTNDFTGINDKVSISIDDVWPSNKLTKKTYYDDGRFYFLGGGDRSVEVKDGEIYFEFKSGDDAFAFKLEKDVIYSLKVEFTPSGTGDRGIRAYTSSGDRNSSNEIINEETSADSGVKTTWITTLSGINADMYLWVTRKNGTVKLHSIELEKVTAPNLQTINQDYFWYFKADGALYSDGYQRDWSGGNFDYSTYRYFPNTATAGKVADSSTEVILNGEATGSYVFQKDDAIGFKLAKGKPYAIKVFYGDRDNYGQNDILFKGVNVTKATSVSGTPIDLRKKDNTGSQTRLMTYYIEDGNDETYWIKNNSDKHLYLGGFEVLPFNDGSLTSEFTGSSWYVNDATAQRYNVLSINDGTKKYVTVAQSHDNVVLSGPTMAINSTSDFSANKTVLLNNKCKIGVYLPAYSKLTFTYIADGGVGIDILGKQYVQTDPGVFEDYYTNESPSAKQIWITGTSPTYVYFSGFTVTQVTPTTPTIADATPISSNYVWYPVNGNSFAAGVFTDVDGKFTLNAGAALTSTGNTTAINENSGRLHGTYTLSSDNKVSFKINGGKKGIIKLYYKGWNLKLYAEGNSTALGMSANVFLDNMHISTLEFDLSNDQIYTISVPEGSTDELCGFEVLFDNNRGPLDLATFNDEHKLNIGSKKETLTNSIDSNTDTNKYNYLDQAGVNGPTMMCYPVSGNNVNVCGKQADNAAIRNALYFKVSDANLNTLDISGVLKAYKNQENTEITPAIKVYRGTESSRDQLLATITEFPAGGVYNVDITGGDANSVYWIVSDNPYGAYISEVKARKTDQSYTTLQTINTHYIYNVGDVPSEGIISGTDGHVKLVGKVTAGSAMTVLGQQNNSIVVGEENYLGIKVGTSTTGKKTGYIKVYLNGGSSDSHKMEELPLDQPLGAGGNSSYDPESHTISIGENGGSRGWWYGDSPLKLEAYNKINVEVESVVGNTDRLQLVVQDADGNAVGINYDAVNKRFNGSLPGDSKLDMSKISQIYIQTWKNTDETETVEPVTLKIKSARLMNKPVEIYTGTDENVTPSIVNEVYGGKIYDVQDAHVYCYPFDLGDKSEQLYWISGKDINIAAIEVVYDDVKHAKVVEWYVNKDTKMIVGSDDPNWVWTDFKGNKVKYPEGYDEYVTFYMSSGRQANVSFIMPEAVREVYDWEKVMKDSKQKDWTETDNKITESDNLKATYGKHTIKVTTHSNTYDINLPKSGEGIKFDRDKGQSSKMDKINGELYKWYSYSYDVPSDVSKLADKDYWAGVLVEATQMEDGSDSKVDEVHELEGKWTIYMRFVGYQAPVCTGTGQDDKGVGTHTVTVSSHKSGKTYYTIDSSEPANLAAMSYEDAQHSSTNEYSATIDVTGKNCIVKAAQYLETAYQFYNDCDRRDEGGVSNSLKLVSKDLNVVNNKDNVVYVKDDNLVAADETDKQLFNYQPGGYMLTLPTGTETMEVTGRVYSWNSDKTKVNSKAGKQHEQKFSSDPMMYLTLGGKGWPYLNSSNIFEVTGNDWGAAKDGGLKTYLDSYQFKMDVSTIKYKDWNVAWNTDEYSSGNLNANPYTECNGGSGSPTTEDGGMFLQPIGGTMLRFEPEYDGVITVWLRQNGCLDNNTQENGKFARRPVFIMDENGRLMRRSTIKPTAEHYLGINGTYAINSSVCEERSQVEHTWLHAVAKQVFANNPLYADRFGDDFPNRWEVDGLDHAGHIMYGWWYKGFSLDATRSSINSASHVSRFEYMEPELLYRSDKIYDMEMNTLGLNNTFAKYGYELPNFQYVRYRIPVKAGKTYYIAGRGTKNGFSAISFDPVKANTNDNSNGYINALRYSDNPGLKENTTADPASASYLKLQSDWSKAGTSSTTVLTAEEAIATYNSLKTVTIKESAFNKENSREIQNEVKYDMDGVGNLVGQTVNVTLERKFTKNYWHPIMLPFSLSETRLEQYFGEGTKVLYLDPYKHTYHNKTDYETGESWISAISPALENSRLYFTIHRYNMLYANTPAFICPTFEWSDTKKAPATNKVHPTPDNNGVVSDITFKRVTLDGSNRQNDLGDGYFGYAISNDYEVVGSYDNTNQSGDVYYVNNSWNGEKNEAQLMHSVGNSVNMKPTRVWIRPKAGATNYAPIRTVGAKDFSELDFDFDNEEAGISDIVADDITVEGYANDEGVYDLLGRKMGEGSLEGLPSGVYIFKGQKVYVK